MANELELTHWLSKGYRAEEMKNFWANSLPDDLLVLCHWDGQGHLTTACQKAGLSGFAKVGLAFFADVLSHSPCGAGHFMFCAHDAMWSERSADFPIFAFSKQIADRYTLLIPDAHYLAADGYENVLSQFAWMNEKLPWSARKPTAFWRGTSTGAPAIAEDTWRNNPRVKLCMFAKHVNDESILQATFSKIEQCQDESLLSRLATEGLVTGPIEFIDFSVFRYQINIDGNSTSWSLFLKLFMDSLVFKIDGQHMDRYYRDIEPWKHFIPVKSDLSDLLELLQWAKNHDEALQQIARNAQEFVLSQSYKHVHQELAEQLKLLFAVET